MALVIGLQLFVTLGNLLLLATPTLPHLSSSAIRRSSRSMVMMKKEQADQRCVGCDNGDAQACPKKTFRRVMRYEEKLKCMPEPTLVKLRAPAPHLSVKPSLARVNRCSGYCGEGFRTCLPTKATFVKIPVLLKNHHKGFAKCVEYEVEEHEECACDCEIRMEHCSERHKHESCLCKCRNELEKYECLEDERKVWDEDKCECTSCAGSADEETGCAPDFMWDTKECRCEMISPVDISENVLY